MKLNLKTEPKLTVNNDLKITSFEILYPFPRYEFEDTFNLRILIDLMSTYSLKNRTRQAFNEENDLNYIADYDVDFFTKGNTQFLQITFLLPGSGIFEDFDLEKSLNVVKDHIFRSIILADDISYEYNIYYDRIFEDLNTRLSDPRTLFNDTWMDLYNFKHDYYKTNIEQLGALKKSSIERVKELYNKIILNGDYISFISGNINDKDYYKETFDKIFKPRNNKIILDVNYDLKYKPDWFGHVDKTTNNPHSILRVGYYKEKATKRDKYLMMFLSCCMWRRENNILFNKLRLENDLVYSCNCSYIEALDSITVDAYLSKENINKALVVIDECMNLLLDEEIFNNCKEKLLKADNITFISYLDDKFYKSKKTRRKLLKFETFEDEYKELCSITYDEMKECINSLNKVAELIMIGDKNDQD